MELRADFALEEQLEGIAAEAAAPEVKEAVAAVLTHLRSGKGRHRRGGQTLVRLLEQARLRASEEDEWHVVRLLQDSLDYSTGRLLRPSFEENYRLFQEGKERNPAHRDFLASTANAALGFWEEQGRRFLREHPDATANELFNYFVGLREDLPFLQAPADQPGRYKIVRGSAEMALWLERVLRNRVDVEDPAEAAGRIAMSPEALKVLAEDEDGQSLLKAAELKRRAASITELRGLSEDPAATEHDLQRALQTQPWIFGGQFIRTAAHRRLVSGDEVDIPLLRADGTLHLVELKRAMGARALVKRHRNAWVPTSEVHDAVGQAINYLVGLDENRQRIREEFGIETRRASALVLIGHPALHPDLAEEDLNQVLRTLNTHTSRVEVLTYAELLDSAERSLGGIPTTA
ncbi:Shedu immune nuclease family protein [Saccharopolyspora sp. NPDC002686]|uniref:Shedu immune nuclease family protein n=1 Tax=Saccharopolyspora sp. NPDC002686 TaxID=3154541 RepID=UPI00332DEFC3